MADDDVSVCAGCHRTTPTVLGKCADCWYPKTAAAIPAPRRYAGLWDGDDLPSLLWALSWAPAVVALVLGLVLDVPALVVIGGGLIALRLLASYLLSPWNW